MTDTPHYGGYGPGSYGPDPYGSYRPFVAPPPPKPGCVPLRPLGLGEILDGSFRVVRNNPKVTLGLSAVIAVFQAAITGVATVVLLHHLDDTQHQIDIGLTPSPGSVIGPTLGLEFTSILAQTLFTALLAGMLTTVVTQDVLGVRTSLTAAWQTLRPRLFALIWLVVVISVVEVIGLVLCIAPGVWLWGIWSVAVPALVVEKIGPGSALSRSQRLVSGTFWRVWGIRALGTVIALIIQLLAALPFKLAAGFSNGVGLFSANGNATGYPIGYVLLTSIGTVIALTVTSPIRVGIDALLYVDLRMRKEGLDIALQRIAAAGAAPSPPPPVGPAGPAPAF